MLEDQTAVVCGLVEDQMVHVCGLVEDGTGLNTEGGKGENFDPCAI